MRARPERASLQRSRGAAGAASGAGALRPPAQDGAIAVLPGRSALLVALEGRLWRVSTADGSRAEIALGRPLTHVSQLIVIGAAGDGIRAIALRGYLNEIAALRLSPDGDRAEVADQHRVRLDTPLRAAFDGRVLHVLLSPVRHHPSRGGDGRPNVPGRIAQIEPAVLTGSTPRPGGRGENRARRARSPGD